jgi:hypothetical protein
MNYKITFEDEVPGNIVLTAKRIHHRVISIYQKE